MCKEIRCEYVITEKCLVVHAGGHCELGIGGWNKEKGGREGEQCPPPHVGDLTQGLAQLYPQALL